MSATDDRLRVVVLISGGGTNLQALLDRADSPASPFRVCGVVSNRPGVRGLERAERHGVPSRVLDHVDFEDRATFDTALAELVDSFDPGLVVLAGFMRILTAGFVEHFAGRMVNIHPSLLPEFQGLHTHRRALEAGVGEHGASVHFVTAELDGGPVIAQVRVPVLANDDEDVLAARVLAEEHRLLPQVVCWFAEQRLELRDDRVWFDGKPLDGPMRCCD
ncbi:MAG: phosphoribosylglycinamide formyltransferase [Gammaproteobacteria bacterium]|nr:phosphoribosylglycinamide formyltransferase [Gammaproteobacteria bacterium]